MSNRRDFFKSFNNKEKKDRPIRPPYHDNKKSFEECIECQDKSCALACEQKIIFILDDGSPSLDFSKVGCTFCQECALACNKKVLSLENNKIDKIYAKFFIDPKLCIAHNGVICFSCKEPCIDNAILFNGMFNPIIDNTLCTSCGYCINRCITNAITYKITQEQT